MIARPEELALLFTEARTHYAWLPDPVDDSLLQQVYELARWAPTGGNGNSLRVVFVKSPAAKERLVPALFPQNVEKVKAAPVTAILAFDVTWYEQLGKLAPFRPEAREQIAGMPPAARDGLGTTNATLQAGYLILAARALGLDCGPMGGFDRAKVDAEFFPDGAWRSLILLNLGHGDPAKTLPRMPRLDFAAATKTL